MNHFIGRATLAGCIVLFCVACDESTGSFPDTGPDISSLDVVPPVDIGDQDTTTDIIEDTLPPQDIEGDITPSDTQDGDTGFDSDVVEEDGWIGPIVCDPPLSLLPETAKVLPYQLVTFIPEGGTGAYQFAHANNGEEDLHSNPIINLFTGAYVAGPITQTVDIIALTDLGCEGEATAEVHVLDPMEVSPSSAVIPPNTTMQLEVEDGSGSFGFVLLHTESGATITEEGLYTGGPAEGVDTIEVSDNQTSQTINVSIQVTDGAEFIATPSHIFIAEGSQFVPVFSGGTGVVEMDIEEEEFVTLEDGVLVPGIPGRTTIAVTDHFTGQSTSLLVDTVSSVQSELERAGDNTNWTYFSSPGDINQDGYPDAVLAHFEADVGAWNAGAIFIYQGDDTGLAPEPVRIISNENRNVQIGRSMKMVDLNQDDLIDLVVGSTHADIGLNNNGAVYVYLGVENGFFEENPAYVLIGPGGSDYLGWSVAVCDFNGDSRLDIVAGAPYLEDEDTDLAVTNQGGFLLWLGYPDGFLPDPNMEVYAQLPDGEGGWTAQASQFGGQWMTAGDLNNDGLCDMAMTAYSYTAPGEANNNSGAVLIYMGVAADGVNIGGLTPLPSRVIAGEDNSQFGRTLAMGDLNGDEFEDLVVGHPYFDGQNPSNPTATLTDSGAVRLYLGGEEWTAAPATVIESYNISDWHAVEDSANDRLGWGVRVRDVDGVPGDELMVGSFADEITAGKSATGSIQLFGLPEEPDPLEFQLELLDAVDGLINSDYFGTALDAIGDLDNDGIMDWIGFSLRNDDFGLDVGRPYYIRRFPNEEEGISKEFKPLDLPGNPAGQRIGWAVAGIGDVNNDGYDDVAVGAPLLDFATEVNQTTGQLLGYFDGGQVTLHFGGPQGPSTEPDVVIREFFGHGGGTGSISGNDDELGYAVGAAGDFDGDGIDDMVLAARISERMGTPNSNYFAIQGVCGGQTNNVGGVFVFRGQDKDIPELDPMLLFWPEFTGGIQEIVGGLDINGDGNGDVVISSYDWDQNGSNSGGFIVLYGQDADPSGKPILVCPPEPGEENPDPHYETFLGTDTNAEMGRSIAVMGHLNDDVCDDFVVGVPREAYTYGATTMVNEGSVRVIYGWGGPDCPPAATQTVLTAQLAYDRFGHAVDGGQDLDGDEYPDLVVGAYNYGNTTGTVGAATFIPGHYLVGLPTEPLISKEMGTAPQPSIDDSASGVFRIEGTTPSGQFGWDIAVTPDVFADNTGLMAVGVPKGDLGSVALSGGVQFFQVYPWDSELGVNGQPYATFSGEVTQPEGRIGDAMAFGGLTGSGPSVIVGGYWGNGVGMDAGSAYILDLSTEGSGSP